MLDPGNRARLEGRPVHDRRIELVHSFVGEDGALAGVKERRVFEYPDGRLDGIEPAAAALQYVVAREQGLRELILICLLKLGRHALFQYRARSPMNDEPEGSGLL